MPPGMLVPRGDVQDDATLAVPWPLLPSQRCPHPMPNLLWQGHISQQASSTLLLSLHRPALLTAKMCWPVPPVQAPHAWMATSMLLRSHSLWPPGAASLHLLTSSPWQGADSFVHHQAQRLRNVHVAEEARCGNSRCLAAGGGVGCRTAAVPDLVSFGCRLSAQ